MSVDYVQDMNSLDSRQNRAKTGADRYRLGYEENKPKKNFAFYLKRVELAVDRAWEPCNNVLNRAIAKPGACFLFFGVVCLVVLIVMLVVMSVLMPKCNSGYPPLPTSPKAPRRATAHNHARPLASHSTAAHSLDS